MVSLIARPVIHKTNLFACYNQFFGRLVKGAFLLDFIECLAHRLDAMFTGEVHLDDFLVAHIALIIFADKKHPNVRVFLVSLFAFLVMGDRLSKSFNQSVNV